MDTLIEIPVWALMAAPSGTAILGVIIGYWMRMASLKDMTQMLDVCVGDTNINVAGDYVEAPIDESEMSRVFVGSKSEG
jgi:hypothetical protein